MSPPSYSQPLVAQGGSALALRRNTVLPGDAHVGTDAGTSRAFPDGLGDPRPALSVRNLSVRLGKTDVVRRANIIVPTGVMFAVIGPNGAGKSSLLKAIVGLIPRLGGEVSVHGSPHAASHECVRHRIAFLPQRSDVDLNFPITVFEVAAMGLYPRLKWWRGLGQSLRSQVMGMLESLGIDHLHRRPLSDLSGGQQQKVFLARAFLQDPKVILLDEPFNGIDAPSVAAITKRLRKFCADQGTVVCVHHNIEHLRHDFHMGVLLNVFCLHQGPIHELLDPENLARGFVAQNDVSPPPSVV